MRISKYLPLIVLIIVVVLLSVDSSLATTVSVENIADKFQEVGGKYLTDLKKYAFAIFKIFILIDVGIFGVRAALNRSEIAETISQFLMMLIFATFCAVAINYYEFWTKFLLAESKTIAAAVSGGNVEFTPFNTGLDIMKKIIAAAPSGSISAAIQTLGYLILGGVVMVCFCLMGARMLVILCESYIAIAAAILLLGFGGSSMVKDYAINTMRYAVSVAFKLFIIRLLMGVSLKFINDLGTFDKVDLPGVFMILAAAVVLLVLVSTLPETVAGIINGSHTGSGVGLGSAAKGVAAAVVGAAALAGGAAIGGAKAYNTVSRAVKLASMDGHTGAANKAKGAAGHLWNSFQAARQDAATNPGGSIASRMHSNVKDMHQAQKAMKDPNHQANPYRINRLAGSSGDSKKSNDSADSPGGG